MAAVGSTTPFQANWAEIVATTGGDHDHRNTTHHQGFSTPNFELVGFNPLHSDYYGQPPGAFGCSNTRSNAERALSITGSFATDAGVIISDVTDPTNPQKISELVMPSTHVYDNVLTPDMRWALIATSPFEPGPE